MARELLEEKIKQNTGRVMRFTDSELNLIKNTFRGNIELLLLMRKIFLPELDPKAPLGQMIDLWMSVPVKEMNPDQAVINILARNSLIMHVEQQLMQLNVLAEMDSLTLEEALEKGRKDSSK